MPTIQASGEDYQVGPSLQFSQTLLVRVWDTYLEEVMRGESEELRLLWLLMKYQIGKKY